MRTRWDGLNCCAPIQPPGWLQLAPEHIRLPRPILLPPLSFLRAPYQGLGIGPRASSGSPFQNMLASQVLQPRHHHDRHHQQNTQMSFDEFPITQWQHVQEENAGPPGLCFSSAILNQRKPFRSGVHKDARFLRLIWVSTSGTGALKFARKWLLVTLGRTALVEYGQSKTYWRSSRMKLRGEELEVLAVNRIFNENEQSQRCHGRI